MAWAIGVVGVAWAVAFSIKWFSQAVIEGQKVRAGYEEKETIVEEYRGG